MKKIKVACFFGGKSAEYSVSLVSASAIIDNINTDKFQLVMIGIDKDGNFHLYDGTTEDILNDTWKEKSKPLTISLSSHNKATFFCESKELTFDVAFPILHGTNGEDGRIQGLFELMGIKYVGCDMASSSLCMDKFVSKMIVKNQNIPIAKSILVLNTDSYLNITDEAMSLKFPLFVKPLKAGSSFGISKIETLDELSDALDEAFKFDKKVIIEEAIEGFEVGCAIIGNEELIIGAVDEIELSHGFFNFEEKYTLKTSKIHLPARLSVSEMQKIQDTALTIYKVLGCKGCARVDMFYTSEGKIVFNEVNTMPGFTENSRFPNMLKAVGYTFEHVLEDLIRLGMEHE